MVFMEVSMGLCTCGDPACYAAGLIGFDDVEVSEPVTTIPADYTPPVCACGAVLALGVGLVMVCSKNCGGIPLAVDEEETTPIEHEPMAALVFGARR
jgi:hypothetical protein